MRCRQIFEPAHGILVLIALLSSEDSGDNPEPSMRESDKLCQRGSNSDGGFFLEERIQIDPKVGHHRSASEPSFKWRFVGGPVMAQH